LQKAPLSTHLRLSQNGYSLGVIGLRNDLLNYSVEFVEHMLAMFCEQLTQRKHVHAWEYALQMLFGL
jgi:hypothetical protein